MLENTLDQVQMWRRAGDNLEDFSTTLHATFGWSGDGADTQDFRWHMNLGVLKCQDGRGEPRIQMAQLAANTGRIQIRTGSSPDIVIIVPVTGRLAVARDGHTAEAGDGQAIICQPLSQATIIHQADGGDCEAFIIEVAYAWMQRFLFDLLQMPVEKDLQLGPLFDAETPRGRLLAQLVAYLCSNVFIAQSRDMSPSLQQNLMEAFSHVVLESVPHRYSARLTAPQAGPMPNYVRLARDYMHREARRNPSMADVAKAAGISVRTLETSFRQYLDVTPHTYLRTVRLRMARQALRSRGNGAGIAGIATEFGFPHAGRFAQYYTELFGESPSDTRRKGPQAGAPDEGDGI